MTKKIAIIGSGISGLTCAHLLHKEHDIQVFEAGDYIGGHTATKTIQHQGKDWKIDTGFIVFNDRTYPNFEKLLARIGIERLATEMSFSVRNQDSGLEYNGNNLNSLFAQRSNLFKPSFLKLIKDILKFNGACTSAWKNNEIDKVMTLGEFLEVEGFSDYFAQHYILPMGAAIWSASLDDMKAFPLYFFVRFFYNHGLLSVNNRPQWYVIPNGSNSYIAPLIEGFREKIHLNSPVTAIKREQDCVWLTVKGQQPQAFDEVILACHSDQALAMLEDSSELEKSVLGQIPYQENDVVLHTDTRFLPTKKLAWAAWNYHLNSDNKRPAALTYNMNILQRLPSDAPTFCVTLNQNELIDQDKVIAKFRYAHPVFNTASIAAQQRRAEICGHQRTHFAGAYWYNGFHEDGVRSALDVCKRFGLQL
ncbi:NAD(P)/FAD-dependent oxidoreductase [Motilimonas pumila]|uniref:FAD-dependent oxidoreductase n=1 Tax=Motilimonas pumila TaxID=2303987 RepID=A0A418YFH9_9GAMM|nr:FAD-dependent oxidoreductase [Motilimonas pumila]RJG48135.1 FAD-dependent oxidoreductase [Motilimonas pumila]